MFSEDAIWVVGVFILHTADGGSVWNHAYFDKTSIEKILDCRAKNLNYRDGLSIRFLINYIGWIKRRSSPGNFFFTQDGGMKWKVRIHPSKYNYIDDLIYIDAKEA